MVFHYGEDIFYSEKSLIRLGTNLVRGSRFGLFGVRKVRGLVLEDNPKVREVRGSVLRFGEPYEPLKL